MPASNQLISPPCGIPAVPAALAPVTTIICSAIFCKSAVIIESLRLEKINKIKSNHQSVIDRGSQRWFSSMLAHRVLQVSGANYPWCQYQQIDQDMTQSREFHSL